MSYDEDPEDYPEQDGQGFYSIKLYCLCMGRESREFIPTGRDRIWHSEEFEVINKTELEILKKQHQAECAMTKLKVGSIILVHGFVMLKGLEDGCKYKIQSMPQYYGQDTYQFTKVRGKKFVARHLAKDVDCWINENNLNRIEILS